MDNTLDFQYPITDTQCMCLQYIFRLLRTCVQQHTRVTCIYSIIYLYTFTPFTCFDTGSKFQEWIELFLRETCCGSLVMWHCVDSYCDVIAHPFLVYALLKDCALIRKVWLLCTIFMNTKFGFLTNFTSLLEWKQIVVILFEHWNICVWPNCVLLLEVTDLYESMTWH